MTTQSKRRRIRYRLILGTSLSLGLLGISTAHASLQPGGWSQQWQDWAMENLSNPLEDILAQIEETTALAEEALQNVLGDQWESLKAALGSNLPDLHRVRMDEAMPIQSILGTDRATQQRDLANRYDQEVARSMASPWLGDQGQARLSDKAEQTSALLDNSQAHTQQAQSMAEDAQGMNVTQNVMKQNAQIQASVAALLHEQTQLTAENNTTLTQLHQLQGMLTQLAANTSEGIDEVNRREQVARQISISGSAQAPIYIPGALGTSPSGN
ncbi:hypothetical protein IQ254_12640 [Nodosilinea sp. LEGE 07088]|uniref:hypothetical protein n=1 Tax=Nodosilinea sp. LEGE 07088 TaxID=2777968 RepID=UPI00187FE286|nr:hypothetical protein [Nodosilinea sp. LEGE 07088]MBE9138026.1 hypothetical protein [Nodosilinea sp. LEGE 07088]